MPAYGYNAETFAAWDHHGIDPHAIGDSLHLLQFLTSQLPAPGGMRGLYDRFRLIATSTAADVVLIRSHVAYHSGRGVAERSKITPSRGHSYKIDAPGFGLVVVRITDHYDHRNGVEGWASIEPRGLFSEVTP